MKQQIFDEINRLYAVEAKFHNLLDELSHLIISKTTKSYHEIYEEIITKYFFEKPKSNGGEDES